MYQVGEYIVYRFDGVCKVEKIGPIDIEGVQEGMDYYTLVPVYQNGRIYVPVEAMANSRPVLSREEAMALIANIPNLPLEIFEHKNPKVLGEYYKAGLKSNDCRELLKMIRSIYVKGEQLKEKGRRLGQVDARSFKQAEDMLHGELAVSLGIPVEEVKPYIADVLEK